MSEDRRSCSLNFFPDPFYNNTTEFCTHCEGTGCVFCDSEASGACFSYPTALYLPNSGVRNLVDAHNEVLARRFALTLCRLDRKEVPQ